MSHSWFQIIRKHYADRLELAGLVDLIPESTHTFAEQFADLAHGGAIHCDTSLEAALAAVRPDVVFDCTVPDAHFGNIETALRAGCDVLTEKPLTATVAQARTLVTLAEQTGRTLAVIQNRRHLDGGTVVRRALEAGVIGKVHTAHVDFFLAPRFGGFRDAMDHVLLLDMAIHTFDQARYMTGLDPISADCHEFNPSGSWYAHGASAVVTFEMSGGAVFNYRGSWCARGLPTSWNGQWRIIGEKGTLTWDGESQVLVETVETPGDQQFFEPVVRQVLPVEPLPEGRAGHGGIIGEFLDALDAGQAPQTVASDNIRSLAMVEAAIRSAETGARVPICEG